MKTSILLCNLFLFLLIACKTNQADHREASGFQEAVSQAILTDSTNHFNGSILVARGNSVLFRQHYGYIDFDKSKLIDDHSRFNIGSIAKELPAVAILELVEKGELRYEDRLGELLPELPDWAEKISVSDLLFYESGLPGLNLLTANTDEKALRELKQLDALPTEPGTKYLYSNWNNLLQAAIVETLVQEDFQAWVSKQYFQPLEMGSAIYAKNPPEITENMTRSYSAAYGDDAKNNPNFKKFHLSYAPLYLTTLDLFKWMEFVHAKSRALSQKDPIFFRQTVANQPGPLGDIEWEENQIKFHQHLGQAYYFGALAYRNYQNDITVLLVTNDFGSCDLLKIRDNILAILTR